MHYDNDNNKDHPKPKKKTKGHKHRKYYDFNDDFQKNKQFKREKQKFDDEYFDTDRGGV